MRLIKDPNLEGAYVAFATELEGGLTEQDRRRLSRMEAIRKVAQEAKP
jgi:hypothetical protein